jgi:Tfp pilus assembly protein FimT
MAGPTRPPWRGFTLSDVLIALASCGLLVMMVAPKIDFQKDATEDARP